ncbi:hypothetical protein [Massilia sp. LC238]|jgi:hypothetical protein|uniref:hypothetical protein n=1 Tax=Massilia sp. LC238 TaxID=1502852 RepID=UPI00126A4F68|nr:hypothetical protein [Massilia sp. LC238]
MKFGRRRRRSPKMLGLRAGIFALGLVCVLATTDTIQTIGMALSVIEQIGTAIKQSLNPSTTIKKQEEQNG